MRHAYPLEYHEDTTKKHSITKEELEFLHQLQKEMNTQDHLCQADPRYWVIMDYEIDYNVIDGDPEIQFYDDETIKLHTWEEIAAYITNKYGYQCELGYSCITLYDDDHIELDTLFSFEDVVDWLNQEEDGEDWEVAHYEERRTIVPDTFFLTHKAALDHLQKNAHHYSEKAHPYAMTAWRSPEVEMLWKILETVDFNHFFGNN